MTSPSSQYGSVIGEALEAGLLAGFIVGFFEATVIATRVLLHNAVHLSLIADLVKFISLATVLFLVFTLAVSLMVGSAVVFISRVVTRRNFSTRGWSARLIWFFVAAFTLGMWVNYNTPRPALSGKSLLYDALVVVGALLVAEIASRTVGSKRVRINPLRKGTSRSVALIWLAALVLAFLHNAASGKALTADKPNVILLIVDTLRADRLGCYGYDKNTTPAIDALAKRSVLFEQTYVQWASSLPSHASIMTSMYPYYHGAFPNGKNLNPELLTLVKILREYGYRSAAFVTNSLVGEQYNFNLGYDTFVDQANFEYANTTLGMWVRQLNLIRIIDHLRHDDLITELTLAWLDRNTDAPFFLWTQWLDPHAPYRPAKQFLRRFEKRYHGIADGSLRQIRQINQKKLKLDKKDIRHYEALYDGEVAASDYQIQRVLDRLETLGLLDNSLVIITGDHGENLYEHGMEYGHYGVYDSSLRIPLLFFMPKKLPQGLRIDEVVQSIDIAPTILDLLNIPIPKQFQGRSLLPLVRGEVQDWPSVAHSVMFRKDRNFLALRDGDWKLLLTVTKKGKKYELYHIPSDPKELHNLVDSEPEVAERMKAEMEKWIDHDFANPQLVYEPGHFFKEDFDQKTIERLRSLGYIK